MPGLPPNRFVYLGPEGTFAEQALRAIPAAERATRTPAASVPDAFDAVRAGEADAALVPLENSVGGAVAVTLDELARGEPLQITREVVLAVDFVLAVRASGREPAAGTDAAATPERATSDGGAGGRSAGGADCGDPGAPQFRGDHAEALRQLRTVAAHPQAAAQCRHWLRRHAPRAVVVEALSNAAAAAAVNRGEVDAAVCAPVGLRRYRLRALATSIADRPDGQTRFALVGRPSPPLPPTGDDVTTVAVYLARDRVGALRAVLTELAVRGVNLTRVESRPTGEGLGSYVFFIDCAGHVAQARMGEALMGLRRVCFDVRFLGSYPRHRPAGGRVPAAPGLSEADFADAAAWLARVRAGEHR